MQIRSAAAGANDGAPCDDRCRLPEAVDAAGRLFDPCGLPAVAKTGGPIVLPRALPGICQLRAARRRARRTRTAPAARNPCVSYALEARDPIDLSEPERRHQSRCSRSRRLEAVGAVGWERRRRRDRHASRRCIDRGIGASAVARGAERLSERFRHVRISDVRHRRRRQEGRAMVAAQPAAVPVPRRSTSERRPDCVPRRRGRRESLAT